MSDSTRVLIVDDDVAVQSSLRAYLEDFGFLLRSTANAMEALSILGNETFDVAVVDVRLREMTGEELVRRAHEIRPEMRFIVYTGSIGYELPESLTAIGVTTGDVFYKPVKALSVIADQVRRLASKS